MVHTSTSAADGNDALSAMELLDFIDKLEVFTESECLAGARTFAGNTNLLLPFSVDASFLGSVLEEFDNVRAVGDGTISTTLALQRLSTPSQSVSAGADSDPGSVEVKTGAFEVGAADTTEQTLTTKKKTSSQRQREEIAYLRGKVRELEGMLESVKDNPVSKEFHVTALPHNAAPVDSAWVTIAKRQLDHKNRAEDENTWLRERLASEIRFVRSLKRMLRKRKDSDIFEMLTRRVDERVRTLGVVSDAQGFTDGNSSYRSPPNIYTDDEGGVKIHLSTATTVPFDFQKVADIVDNVCKRVIQENRVVMLWGILTETRAPDGVQCIQVCSKGCGEILRGEVTANGSPSSLLRYAVSVVPHMLQDANTSIAFNEDGSASKVPKRKNEMVGLLSELLIASHQRNAQTSQQFIENALFDDLIQGSSNSP
ncbi:hypothetical protein FI667_g11895, partial [Globisporangium splendens]